MRASIMRAASLVAGGLFAAGLAAGVVSAQAQVPAVVREAEPVVLTGKQIPDWTRSAAAVLCTPAGGLSGNQDAHHGTVSVPPDARTGVAVDQVVAYRWDGAWVEIPVQVDEMYFYCLANPKSNPGVGFGAYSGPTCWEATYSAPARRNQPGQFFDKND